MSKSIVDECWAIIQAWSWADGSMNVDVATRGKAEVQTFLEDYAQVKVRVKELEAIVAAHNEAAVDALNALPTRETFDPQAVRGLLGAINAAREVGIVLPSDKLYQTAQRVRESEKK